MNYHKGFTLIELIIVMSIIAVLSTLGFSTYNSIQQDARNAKRKADLVKMKEALESYKLEHNGQYPATFVGGARQYFGLCNVNPWGPEGFSPSGATGYIPLLSSTYIEELPVDPKDNQINSSSAWSSCRTLPNYNCYLYTSDGTDYKVMAHCSPEGVLSTDDPFFDPCRPVHAWQVSSSTRAEGVLNGAGTGCNPGGF